MFSVFHCCGLFWNFMNLSDSDVWFDLAAESGNEKFSSVNNLSCLKKEAYKKTMWLSLLETVWGLKYLRFLFL